MRYLRTLGGHVTADAVLAALALTLAWGPLQRKRISRRTAVNLPWYLALYGTLIGAAVPGRAARGPTASAACPNEELLRSWTATELAGLALTGRRPGAEELFAYQVLLGLLLSNGPGTISGAGCEGCGLGRRPRDPGAGAAQQGVWRASSPTPASATAATASRACSSCSSSSRDQPLRDPGAPDHGLDLAAMARAFALAYRQEKSSAGRSRPRERAPSRASTTRCSAASRSTPTRARRSSPR